MNSLHLKANGSHFFSDTMFFLSSWISMLNGFFDTFSSFDGVFWYLTCSYLVIYLLLILTWLVKISCYFQHFGYLRIFGSSWEKWIYNPSLLQCKHGLTFFISISFLHVCFPYFSREQYAMFSFARLLSFYASLSDSRFKMVATVLQWWI